jgi:FixJ family two-component response regulator
VESFRVIGLRDTLEERAALMPNAHSLAAPQLRLDPGVATLAARTQPHHLKSPPESTNEEPVVASKVFVVDDDAGSRMALEAMITAMELEVESFTSSSEFLSVYDEAQPGCLLTEAWRPRISGLDVMRTLKRANIRLPVVFFASNIDIKSAVAAMKEGAVTVLEKPCPQQQLIDAIKEGLRLSLKWRKEAKHDALILGDLAGLTERERQVLDLVVEGMPNKAVSNRLGISIRTVEDRRARAMKKLGVHSFAALLHLVHEARHIESQNAERMVAVC